MSHDLSRLSVLAGERQRVGTVALADALVESALRHGVRSAITLRGSEGYGRGRHRRSDRLLTLSEDLPLAWLAIAEPDRIDRLRGDVSNLGVHGLVTVERVRAAQSAPAVPVTGDVQLGVVVGRRDRASSRPAHEAVVALLHERGVDGATVLLGVDGIRRGRRQRARLRGSNAEVPVLVIAVGDAARIASALPELRALLDDPLITLQPVTIVKRDGRTLAPPRTGEADWTKLTVIVGGRAEHAGRPLAGELVRALRGAGAPGATAVRGIWGFHGDHVPHGDVLWQLRRRVPTVVEVVDTTSRIGDWLAVLDGLTDETGLVTLSSVAACAPGPAVL